MQGEQGEFAHRALRQVLLLVVEVALRPGGHGEKMAAVERFAGGQILGGAPGRADRPGLEQQAYAFPHMAVGELAAGDQRLGQRHAAFGQFERGIPVRAHFGQRRFILLLPARLQRVTGDVVVVADQQRMLGAEQIPLLFFAQRL